MRIGAVIAATGKSGGYQTYEEMESVDGIQILRQMILNFQRAGVEEIVLMTGYQAEQVEKKLAKLGAVFLRSTDYENEEMITSAIRGMQYLKPRCDKVFFCPAGVSLFTEDTLGTILEQASEQEKENRKKHATEDSEKERSGRVYIPIWNEKRGHPILLDQSLIDPIASYQGTGGLKGAMDALKVERVLVPVEDHGVAVYSAQGASFHKIFQEKEKEKKIHPRVKVQLEKNENFFGPGIVFLLRQIDTLGSVRDACAKTGMSYSKGWSLIKTAEKELGFTVVERSPGGKHGGVAKISEAGREVLEKYEQLEKEVSGYAEACYQKIFGINK